MPNFVNVSNEQIFRFLLFSSIGNSISLSFERLIEQNKQCEHSSLGSGTLEMAFPLFPDILWTKTINQFKENNQQID